MPQISNIFLLVTDIYKQIFFSDYTTITKYFNTVIDVK